MQYQVVKYIDVQKNSEGQWYADRLEHTATFVELPDNPKGKEACTALKELGVIDDDNMRKLKVTFNNDIIEVFEKAETKPLCRLERIPN